MILEKIGAVNFNVKIPPVLMQVIEEQAAEEKRTTGEIVRASLQFLLWDRIIAHDPAVYRRSFRDKHVAALNESVEWIETRLTAFRSKIEELNASTEDHDDP